LKIGLENCPAVVNYDLIVVLNLRL